MSFRFAYLYLTLAQSKDHCQGQARLHCEKLANGVRENDTVANK